MQTPFFYFEEIIDLTQEFLPPNRDSLHCKIYRFNIYRLTPNSLFPPENIDYYSINGTYEQSYIGMKWENINGKLTLVEKQISVQQGDNEIQEYISSELRNILIKQISQQPCDKKYLVESAICK